MGTIPCRNNRRGAMRQRGAAIKPPATTNRENHMNTSTRPTILFGIPKLPARYGSLVMPLLLSIFMTGVVSFISTVKSFGLSPQLASRWLSAWGVSWLIAFPVLLLVLPVVRKATALVVRAS